MSSTFAYTNITNDSSKQLLWSPVAIAANSGTAYLAAGIIGINPITAAVFGGVYGLLDTVITTLAKKILKSYPRNDFPKEVIHFRATIIAASALTAYYAMPLIGYTLKQTAALALTSTFVGTAGLLPVAFLVCSLAAKVLDSCLKSCAEGAESLRNQLPKHH